MSGWKVGYMVAPTDVIALLTAVQEPIISCLNAPAQMAALAALNGSQEIIADMKEEYRSQRDQLLQILESERILATRPFGAFYVWVNISAAGVSSMQVTEDPLKREHIAVAPGSAFGKLGEGYVRLSLASAENDLLAGAEGLARAMERAS